MTAILINPFTVFDGCESEFLELWDLTGAIFQAAPGYVSARLCRALEQQPPGQKAPFTHINVAEWQSATLYARALGDPELRRLAIRYRRVCTFDPALYEVIRDV